MRIRSQTIDSVLSSGGDLEWKLEGGPWGPLGTSGPIYTLQDYEEITDDPSKVRKFKPVTHARWYHKSYSPDEIVFTFSGNTYRQRGPNVYSYSWGNPIQYWNIPDRIYAKTEEQAVNDALDKFYNTNEVDSLLNIVEAPQLPDSIAQLYNTARRSGVRSALSLVSKGFLAYSFGIAPLLADMKKVNSAISSYRKDLRKALNGAGKPMTYRSVQTGALATAVSGRFGSTVQTGHQTVLSPPKRIITVKGVNSVRYNSSSFQELDYIMGRFGSRGPASYMWERIPFSFVVDWFVDLRGVTNGLDNLLTGTRKTIEDGCVSEKFAVGFEFKHSNAYSSSQSVVPPAGTTMYSSTLNYYTRKPIVPTTKVVSSGRFGKKQFALTGALLHQLVASRGRS